MTPRRIALNALMEITDRGAYANLALKSALSGIDERDARWISAAVYTTLDHLLYIDSVIAAYARGRLKPDIRGILRLGVCQALYMDVPDSAACNESVKLAKEVGKGALSGFVNGIMRNICRNRDNLPPLPDEPLQRLSVQYSYPEYIVREYLSMYGEGFTEAMLSATEGRDMTIRAQYPYTGEELEKELADRRTQYTRGGLCADAFRLEKGLDVSREPLFSEGKITVQSESAMLVCRVLDPKAGMKILDTCAAPGGKSAYIASITENGAEIDAWELHEHRAELMRRTFERLGVKGSVQVKDASVHYPECDGMYHRVLIDAPCSGLGVPGKPDARYAKSDEIIENIAKLQSRILDACAGYVMPGGTLLYATCTISERENQRQINAFLENHPEYEPGDLSDVIPKVMWRRIEGGCMLQLFPHLDGTEGFFLSKLVRRA
ncbi:MAG: 16S rRNA (cytosine(967)-C(5))-methyltransferase RsmB [Christensenellales bacterium]